MKQRINIALGALQFLYRILSETGVVSRPDARKQHTAFKCMEDHILSMDEKLNATRKQYRVNKPFKDDRGNETDRWVIPEEKKEEFEAKILEIENEKTDVDFDKESLSVVTRALDGLFERQAAKKEKGESDGLMGHTAMKLVEECSNALEAAREV